MAMTTPVISSTTADDATTMSFVMPSAYAAAAPQPMEDAAIEVAASGFEKEQLAVLWFNGFVTTRLLKQKRAELLQLISSSSEWELSEPDPVSRVLQ